MDGPDSYPSRPGISPPEGDGAGSAQTPEHAAEGATGTTDAKTLAMLAHLSILTFPFLTFLCVLGPILVWLLPQRKDPAVVAHAKEALNFQITLLLVVVIGLVAYGLVGLLTLGLGFFVLLPVLILGAVVLVVVAVVFALLATMAANRGEAYRYPMTVRIIS